MKTETREHVTDGGYCWCNPDIENYKIYKEGIEGGEMNKWYGSGACLQCDLQKRNKQLRKALKRLLDNKWTNQGYYQNELAIKYAEKVLKEEK